MQKGRGVSAAATKEEGLAKRRARGGETADGKVMHTQALRAIRAPTSSGAHPRPRRKT